MYNENFPILRDKAATIFEDLYTVFVNTDSTLLEINPLAHITKPNGEDAIVCMDAKISIDDNAELRQGKLFAMKDNSQVEFAEIEASKWDLNYIKLDGNISCMGKLIPRGLFVLY